MSCKRISMVIFIILTLNGCVSMKKYIQLETDYNNCRKDSSSLFTANRDLNKTIDKLTLTNISLGQDTLRLFTNFIRLQEKYNNLSEENRQEIVRLNSQLYGNSRVRGNFRGVESKSKVHLLVGQVVKSINRLSGDLKGILSKYDSTLYSIVEKDLEIVIKVNDSLMFNPIKIGNTIAYDHNSLSANGYRILSQISAMVVERDNFDIVVREYIYINSPYLKYIPPKRDRDEEIVFPQISDVKYNRNRSLNAIPIYRKNSAYDSLTIGLADSLNGLNSSYNSELLNAENKRLDSLQNMIFMGEYELVKLNKMLRDRESAIKFIYAMADRSSTVMKTLMRCSYSNLGDSRISREVAYVKTDSKKSLDKIEGNNIEIVVKLRLSEIHELIKEVELKN